MKPLISVIVPVYKVEPYLRKCVDSILNQTYTNLEVILVDDGSPDNCGVICDEYAEKDSRVRVIHKENGGLSDARNAGMQLCRGDYLSFVDSDDWIEPDHISSMHRLIQDRDNRWIPMTDIRRVEENGKTIARFSRQDIHPVILEAVFGYAWNKLYSAELVKDVFFPEVRFAEDILFNLKVFRKNAEYLFTNQDTYGYLLRPDSILTKPISEEKVEQLAEFSETLWIQLDEEELREQRLWLYNMIAGNHLCNFLCDLAKNKVMPFREKRKMAKKLIRRISGGKLKWKYAEHSLLKLVVISERTGCPWLYPLVYSVINRNRNE